MPEKNDSESKKLFEMLQNLKDRYGVKEPDPPASEEPDEEADETKLGLTDRPAVSPKAEGTDETDDLPLAAEDEEPLETAEEPDESDLIEGSEKPDFAEEPLDESEESTFDEPEESEEDEGEGPSAEELTQAIASTLDSGFSEESPLVAESAEEESAKEDELSEDLIYEEGASEESEEETETPEEEEEDAGLENQIAIDVPDAEDAVPAEEAEEPAEEESQIPEEQPVAAASLTPPSKQTQTPDREAEEFRPMRSIPLAREQKPIAAEQLSLVNPPVMKSDGAQKSEEAPSVETLERSVPDLSTLSDEERKRRSGLSDEDIRMMIEFGYEDDLNRVLGYRTVRKQKYKLRKKTASSRMDLTPFAYSGKEYDGSIEGRNEILRAYRKDKIYLLWRSALTLLFSILSLVCSIARVFFFEGFVRPADNMNEYYDFRPIPILISITLLVFIALFSHKTLIGAYKSLLFFSPTPHAIPALLLPVALVCETLVFFFVFASANPHSNPIPEQLHNASAAIGLITALAFLLSAVGDLLRFSTERHSFLVLSAASQKIAPDPYVRRKKKLQRGEEIVSLIDDSSDQPEYRIRPVDRITGFFRRCGNLSDETRRCSILLSLSFGLSVFSALLLWAFCSDSINPDILLIFFAFINAFLFSAPLASIFAFFYPASLASRKLSRKRSAIIGEESVEELTRKKALLFSDDRVFKAGKCVQTPLRSDSDTKEDLRLSGILFRKIGGVLAQIATPLFPEGPDPSVSILRIRDGGVEALVDNRYHLLAGSREYLVRYGIRFPSQKEEPGWKSPDSATLYVAIDDVLKLRYEVEYRRLDEFDALLKKRRDDGTTIGVYTYDPNLTEAFLKRLYGDDPAPVLAKPGAFDEETEVSVTEAPAVTLDKEESLAETVVYAGALKRARTAGFWTQMAASSIGALLATILSMTQSIDIRVWFILLLAFHILSLPLIFWIVLFKFNQS